MNHIVTAGILCMAFDLASLAQTVPAAPSYSQTESNPSTRRRNSARSTGTSNPGMNSGKPRTASSGRGETGGKKLPDCTVSKIDTFSNGCKTNITTDKGSRGSDNHLDNQSKPSPYHK